MDRNTFFALPSVCTDADLEEQKRIALADQENNAVWVYPLEREGWGRNAPLWSFQAPWPEIFQDIRLRRGPNGRELLLAACSGRLARILDVAGKSLVWESDDLADNPHAIELLPNGILAVGCSTGGQICFFDLKGSQPERAKAVYPLCSAHGLLYDPDRCRLWALGWEELHLLSALPDGGGGIRLTTEAVYPLPSPGGHDLWPVLGRDGREERRMWVTNHKGVFQFSPADGSFSLQYSGAEVISAPNTKAVGNFPDGTVISMVPDGGYFSWTAASFRIVSPSGETYSIQDCPITGQASYKVRVWTARFQ